MTGAILLAVAMSVSRNGVDLSVSSETKTIDPGRSVFVTVSAKSSAELEVTLPDIGSRLRGFSSSEAFAEEPATGKDGRVVRTVNWKLVPEPLAEVYKIAPFAVDVRKGNADLSFTAGPVYFEKPGERPPVTGGIEIDPRKDAPPFSWKRFGVWCLWAVLALAVAAGVFLAARYATRRVKEHFMSPIERAWAELDRLIAKGLPGRGRYKDFYVELTMVVRRYVQRKYGIRAPHLTTEEFLREMENGKWKMENGVRANHQSPTANYQPPTTNSLAQFLESADLVKFAGVEATPEMADSATDSARSYLRSDDAASAEGGAK